MSNVEISLTGVTVWPDTEVMAQHMDNYARRVVLECFQEASSQWWERRALYWDTVGTDETTEIAAACRAKAAFIRMYDDDEAATLLDRILRDAA